MSSALRIFSRIFTFFNSSPRCGFNFTSLTSPLSPPLRDGYNALEECPTLRANNVKKNDPAEFMNLKYAAKKKSTMKAQYLVCVCVCLFVCLFHKSLTNKNTNTCNPFLFRTSFDRLLLRTISLNKLLMLKQMFFKHFNLK